MSMLFLDDSPLRREKFKLCFPHATMVETVAECIEALEERKWKRVYLDHDLNNEAWVDSRRDDCGMEVVRWIAANKPLVKQIIVHSHNHKAAPVMQALLEDAGYSTRRIPFKNLLRSIRGK